MKKILGILIIIILILTINISYNAKAEEGVTDSKIHIGLCGPLTGPAAVWGGVLTGSALLFDIVNSEGGIHGRRIAYRVLDDSYNPAKTKHLVKELTEKFGVFIWGSCLGTENSLAIKDYLIKRNIPWISPLSGASNFIYPPNRYIFGLYPLLSFEAAILCKFAVQQIAKNKIAFVYQNDGYGKSALEGAIKELLKYHITLVDQIPVELYDAKMNNIAQKLKELHADTVLVFTTPFTGVRLLKAASDIDFFPQWMGGITFSDFGFMYKMSNGLWKGMITTQQVDVTDTSSLKKYKEALRKFHPELSEWSVMIHAGFTWTEPLIEALKRCGRDLTRERLIHEMEGLTNFKGVGPLISFKPFNPDDPDCRRGAKELYLIQCIEDGKSKKLSDWIKIE